MKWALGLMAMGLALAPAPGLAQTAHKTSSSAHPSAPKKKSSTASGTTVRTSGKTSSGATGHSSKGHHASHGKTRPAAPAIQNHPDPERYLEIQQALTDRGYFNGDVNGAWGSDSQDALLRFQTDNKLDADGKITALTLQNLGLGPKHDGSAMPLVGRPAAPQPTSAIPPLNAPSSGAPVAVEPAQASPPTTSQTTSHPPATPQRNR